MQSLTLHSIGAGTTIPVTLYAPSLQNGSRKMCTYKNLLGRTTIAYFFEFKIIMCICVRVVNNIINVGIQ